MFVFNDLVSEQVPQSVVLIVKAEGRILHVTLDLQTVLFTALVDWWLVRRVLLHFNV